MATASSGAEHGPCQASLQLRLVEGIGQQTLVATGRQASGAEALQSDFPGWGEIIVCSELAPSVDGEPQYPKLGELASTALCGNDITGSCFYVTGSLAAAAGIWAPFGAVFAAGTLWLFRWVYTEAVTALPFNGGIYNVLLNTVNSKKVAGLVATLTILSYLATCVVSALAAGAYLQTIIDPSKHDPLESGCCVIPVAVLLIIGFAILKLIGISESAGVAALMFVLHLLTMSVLIVVSFLSIASPTGGIPFSMVASNLSANFKYSGGDQNFAKKIVLGFSNAMLGVSGFESSANFVEEQREGVFPKTLRNMWYAVTALNVTFILECLFATELRELVAAKDNALAFLAERSAGRWLQVWVAADAFMILAAAVLTAYVGVGGLASRMAGDRCLPQIFRRSDRVTTILFMMVCISLVLVLEGNSTALAACYSFAFLTVMLLFALSLFVLQLQRPKLPRDMKNNILIPAVASTLVLVAIGGSVASSAHVIPIFLSYLFAVASLVGIYMYRLKVLKLARKVLLLGLCRGCPARYAASLGRMVQKIRKDSSVVYFSKTANLCRLNKAILYIIQNEDTNHCRVVHVYDEETSIPQWLVPFCQILDTIYLSVRIDVVFVQGSFGAPMITHLSCLWDVPTNLMFITCPTSNEAGRRLQDLRGVRVIMGHEEEDLREQGGRNGVVTPGFLVNDRMLSLVSERPENLIDRLLSAGFARHDFSRAASLPVVDSRAGPHSNRKSTW